MPLVIPDLNPASSAHPASNQQEWTTKLLGKKLSDSEHSDETTFCKSDLPKEYRIVEPGTTMMSQEIRHDRYELSFCEGDGGRRGAGEKGCGYRGDGDGEVEGDKYG
ncbi:MAG: hypothetical protein Q9179_001106 [Wetmoreana sp. 5 TL-2023]